jgi:hypothetical protein
VSSIDWGAGKLLAGASQLSHFPPKEWRGSYPAIINAAPISHRTLNSSPNTSHDKIAVKQKLKDVLRIVASADDLLIANARENSVHIIVFVPSININDTTLYIIFGVSLNTVNFPNTDPKAAQNPDCTQWKTTFCIVSQKTNLLITISPKVAVQVLQLVYAILHSPVSTMQLLHPDCQHSMRLSKM